MRSLRPLREAHPAAKKHKQKTAQIDLATLADRNMSPRFRLFELREDTRTTRPLSPVATLFNIVKSIGLPKVRFKTEDVIVRI